MLLQLADAADAACYSRNGSWLTDFEKSDLLQTFTGYVEKYASKA
jgi:hypothetical protein